MCHRRHFLLRLAIGAREQKRPERCPIHLMRLRLRGDQGYLKTAWPAGKGGEGIMAITVRNEGAKVNSNINVTPMVDVMLVLLIIFMVITPMLQKGVTVDLAKVNNPQQMPDADKEDALIVAVMRNGDVFFGNDRIASDQLTNKV